MYTSIPYLESNWFAGICEESRMKTLNAQCLNAESNGLGPNGPATELSYYPIILS